MTTCPEINLYGPLVTICTARFNMQEFYALPTECIYLFDYFPAFITQMELVYCTLQTECLNKITVNLSI